MGLNNVGGNSDGNKEIQVSHIDWNAPDPIVNHSYNITLYKWDQASNQYVVYDSYAELNGTRIAENSNGNTNSNSNNTSADNASAQQSEDDFITSMDAILNTGVQPFNDLRQAIVYPINFPNQASDYDWKASATADIELLKSVSNNLKQLNPPPQLQKDYKYENDSWGDISVYSNYITSSIDNNTSLDNGQVNELLDRLNAAWGQANEYWDNIDDYKN